MLHENNLLFFAMSETWLKDELDAEVSIKGYTIIRSDKITRKRKRFGRNCGGVAIYVRNDVASSFTVDTKYSNESVDLLILTSTKLKLTLACLYRQPENSDKSKNNNKSCNIYAKAFTTALNKMTSTLSNHTENNLVICGDFNLHIDWKSADPCIATGVSASEKEMFRALQQFMSEHFLTQIIKEATHNKGNTLDLIFTNNIDAINNHEINPPILPSYTDHYFITISTNLHKTIPLIRNIYDLTYFRSLNFHHNDINWQIMKDDLQHINWNLEFENLDPEQMLQKFLDICFHVSENHVPKTNKIAEKKHLIPRDRRLLMKRRKRIRKQILTAKSLSRKEKLQSEVMEIEIKLQKSRKNSKLFEEHEAIKSIKKNPKYFFSYAKKHSKLNHNIGPLKGKDGSYKYNNSEMSNIMSDYFVSVFNKPTDELPNKTDIFPDNVDFELTDIELSDEIFIDALSELSPQSSSGPDGLPSVFLKNCKEELATPLRLLWRKCLDESVTPTQLKTPEVIPILKSGDKTVPSNYRPISLTSHIIKTFERIVRNAIVKHLENNDLFNENQHGFRRGRSCLSQLLAHYEQILTDLENKAGFDTVYLDFAKAFDKVDFQILLQKIAKLGIGGKLGHWLYSFLVNREQITNVNGTKSKASKVLSGVPQGSVLGPILFLIMIIDIDEHVSNSTVRSFADDTRVSKKIVSIADVNCLQDDLDKIYSWAEENKMSFNDTKFELLRYKGKNNTPQESQYRNMNNELIEEVNPVKDLGVLMSNDCSFSKHIEKVANSMKNLSGWILRTFSTRDKAVLLTLWKTLVLPIHDYCSQLWSPVLIKQKKLLENIQYSFIRKIKHTKAKNYEDLLHELNLYSLERRRDRYRIIYTWKILEGKVPQTGLIVQKHQRRGRLITSNSHSTNSFNRFAAKAWNELPKKIRDSTYTSVDQFKSDLDSYLTHLEDIPHYYGEHQRRSNNDFISMTKLRKEDHKRLGGSPIPTTL